jgi:thioredoxin reductase (NADPH)
MQEFEKEYLMKYDLIIVGGGPAGMTAGMYGARAGKKVLIFEKETPGGQIARAATVENYPAIKQIGGADYAAALFTQAEEMGCEFAFETVLAIQGSDGDFTVKSDGGSYECKRIILAVGAASRRLGLEREEELTGRGVSYCAICDGAFYKARTVAVVGGGNSALEDALYLAEFCEKVYLIHRRDTFRAENALVERLAAEERIECILSSQVIKLCGEKTLNGIEIEDSAGNRRTLGLDGLFIAIGHVPETEAFASLVKLGEGGYIAADEGCETSIPGIYTAGDCRTKAIRQLATACADGTAAALLAIGHS